MKALNPKVPGDLINGRKRQKEHQSTWEMPSTEDVEHLIQNASKGSLYAKIGFESDDRGGERFWAKVTACDKYDDGFVFTGEVANDLVRFPELLLGESVKFYPEHVLDVISNGGSDA